MPFWEDIELSDFDPTKLPGKLAGLGEELGAQGFKTFMEFAEDIGDMPDEFAKFVSDPEGIIDGVIAELEESIKNQYGGYIKDGLVELGGDVLDEVGMRPLVDGVATYVEKIEEVADYVVNELKDLTSCVKYAGDQTFWTLTGVLVGARAAKIITTEEDCKWVVLSGQIAEMLGEIDGLVAMLECAIKAAFKIPLPEPRPAVRGDLPASSGPILGVVAVVMPLQAYEERAVWDGPDAETTEFIKEGWGAGWRIAHMSKFNVGDEVRFSVVQKRTTTDQVWVHNRLEGEFAKFVADSQESGMVCTSLTTHLSSGKVQYSGAFERPSVENGADPAAKARDQQLLDLSVPHASLDKLIQQREAAGFRPYFLVPQEIVPREDFSGLRYALVSRKPAANPMGELKVRYGALPFDEFVLRNDLLRSVGMSLISVAAVYRTAARELLVSGVWHEQPDLSLKRLASRNGFAGQTSSMQALSDRTVLAKEPSFGIRQLARVARGDLVYLGWPLPDFTKQWESLRSQGGWSVLAIAGYAS